MYNLFHGSEIVGSFDRFDVELSVVFFRWLPIFKDDTGRCRICSLDVRVVKTLKVTRFLRHTQIRLHLGHDALYVAVGINNLNVLKLLLTVVHRILNAEVNEFLLLPFLRYCKFNPFEL